MNKKKIFIIAIVFSVVLAVISWLFLPDELILQVGADGQPSKYAPKLFGVLFPFIISVVGCIQYLRVDDERTKKSLILIAIGYVAVLLNFIFNH